MRAWRGASAGAQHARELADAACVFLFVREPPAILHRERDQRTASQCALLQRLPGADASSGAVVRTEEL
jgi:hypothetical protein